MTQLHLSAAFVERLGWVLVHSIWQFAFIALAALVLQRVMQRASSVTRYWVLLLALGTMMVAPVATWLAIPQEGQDAEVPAASNQDAEVPAASNEDAVPREIDVTTTALPQPEPAVAAKPPADLLEKSRAAAPPAEGARVDEPLPPAAAYSFAAWWSWIEQGLRPWLNALVIAWCIGVFAFAMRPIASWFRVRRLRTVGVSAPPDAVQQMLQRTAERLRLRQAVRVLQSSLVKTAAVVGYFRPVILLPVSVIMGLSPAQLEAILAHELAHIRRHDYLVNVLQILVETVFFYHPAIWWLSKQIRSERENCCDDIAVAVLGNRVEYGRALLALEEHRTETALSVGAQGGSLLARIRRLLGSVPPGRAFSGGTIVGLGLLAAVTIAIGVWAANGLGEADAEALAQEPDQAKKTGAVFKAPGHTLDVALSPDGKILARAGTSKTIELRDVASGKQLHTLKGQSNMWPPVFKVAFSPDGKILASNTESTEADKAVLEVKLWDVATGKERVPLKGHRSNVYSLAFSADGKTLATFHLDPGAVRLWDLATGKEKMKLDTAGTSLAFSPDGKTLATFGDGVQLWDLTTGKKRASMPETRHVSVSLAFSPDGKTLVSAGSTTEGPEKLCQLKLWDVATAKERATIAMPEFDSMLSIPLVFTADGKTLITAGWIFEKDEAIQSGQITLPVARVSVQHWDLATGKARATFWTPVNPGGNHEFSGNVVGIYFAALSADGKTVAWGGAEGEGEAKNIGTAHVWEVQSLATSPPEIPKEVAEKNKEAAEHRKDMEDLNGTWKLRAVEVNGRRQDPKHPQTQMRIEGFRSGPEGVLTLDTPEGHKFPSANYRIDVSRRPKTIDMVFTGKPFSPPPKKPSYISVKAIYLLEGDRLTICRGRERALPEDFNGTSIDTEPRPTEFKTQPDDGLTLEIYERVTEREQRDTEREKAEGTFSLQMPAQAIFVKPGEKKTVTLGIRRGKRFEEDVAFTFTDVPKGVTFEPAKPVSKHPSTEVEFTIQAAKDAALGDFAIKVTGGTANGHASGNQLDLSVDPAGEAAREQPGKPRRRYLRPSREPYTGTFDFSMAADEIAHDGEILSVAGGKLTMKSKDGTEHSYTLADNPQITYQNARSALEANADVSTPLKPGMIVRVTAKKAKPHEATRIEAVYAYGAFMAEYIEGERQKSERERQKMAQQEIERKKKVQQDIDHLQGTWLVVSSQTGDKEEPEESLKKQRVIIQGNHLTLAFGNERNEKREGTIKIDPPAKSLDWVIPLAGDAAMKAIYELKGDDLKIGFGVDGLLRPTHFEMSQDQVGWLLVLKRERQDATPAPRKEQEDKKSLPNGSAAKADLEGMQGTWLVVSSQVGDEKEPAASTTKKRVIVKGDKFSLEFGNERNEKREGTIKIDPKTKAFDWIISGDGGATMKGIYAFHRPFFGALGTTLHAREELKLGFGVDGLVRPTRWEMSKDQVGWLLVLKPPQGNWNPGQVGVQKALTNLVVGTWREDRIRPGMKEPQILKFSGKNDLEFFVAGAKGGHWIKGTFQTIKGTFWIS